jgi:hypothetical protein
VAVNIFRDDALLPFPISTRRKMYRTRTRAETEIGNGMIRFQLLNFRAANLYRTTLRCCDLKSATYAVPARSLDVTAIAERPLSQCPTDEGGLRG